MAEDSAGALLGPQFLNATTTYQLSFTSDHCVGPLIRGKIIRPSLSHARTPAIARAVLVAVRSGYGTPPDRSAFAWQSLRWDLSIFLRF